MKFDKKYIRDKAYVIVAAAILACGGIVFFIGKSMTVDRKELIELRAASHQEKDGVTLPPARGNILSANGELMASSLPNYKVYFDFLAGIPSLKDTADAKLRAQRDTLIAKRDAFILDSLDTISRGLARICPALTADGYHRHLKAGLEAHSRYYDVCPGYILNYIQYNQLRELPVFNIRHRYRNGLVVEERNNRKKPFGSLASRLLGQVYGAQDKAIYGLELAYDSLLRGEEGMLHQRRIRSHTVEIVDKEPVAGNDLVSTIDVSMQDICESALREKLKEVDAEFGLVILMEVQTGDVKAMVNLVRDPKEAGQYRESLNYSIGSAMEPGSTFKTASIMVALDDGEISVDDVVDTGCGLYNFYGRYMKDAGWARHGGHGVIDVTHVMMYSSNVGVSRLIDSHYHNKPEKFVEGLKRVGIGAPLGLPFKGALSPMILGPKENRHWAAQSIPWMSIGYGSMIPPINTAAFYNAIANNGKMVRPRFVKGISRNGEVVELFPVEVVRERICKEKTLREIRGILKQVVNGPRGTGRRARSGYFSVSGKTGTAQVAMNGSYRNGMHFVSFCGYYPSDNPQYTCLVSVQTRAYGASGGGTSGTVFAEIANRIYSKAVTADISKARDSLSVFTPDVKPGNMAAAQRVLAALNVPHDGGAEWGAASVRGERVVLAPLPDNPDVVPDLLGLGARDAIFAAEKRGLKVRLKGCGQVRKQSMEAGSAVVRGRAIVLELD